MRRDGAWTLAASLSALAVLGLPAGPGSALAAQEEARAETRPGTAGEDGAVVEYRREVFGYPMGGRRDPFRPAGATFREGPRFEDLILTGVIHAPAVGSVAVLLDRTTGRRYRVREGERLGDVRVTAIQPGEVRFLIAGLGGGRSELLRVKQPEDGEV